MRLIVDHDSIYELKRAFPPDDFGKIIRCISRTPTADARENIHANWLKEEYFGGIFKCSNCGKYVDFRGLKGTQDPTNFCPNCGANMREETGDAKEDS